MVIIQLIIGVNQNKLRALEENLIVYGSAEECKFLAV